MSTIFCQGACDPFVVFVPVFMRESVCIDPPSEPKGGGVAPTHGASKLVANAAGFCQAQEQIAVVQFVS